MAETTTTRLGIVRWSSDDDEFTRVQMDLSHEQLEELASKFLIGSGAPPTGDAQYLGTFYFQTSNSTIHFYTGTSWVAINSMATTTAGMQAGSTSVVGTSALSARADHVHALPRGLTAPQNIGTTAAIGTSGNVSDAGHVHIIGSGAINSAAMLVDSVVSTAKIANDAVTADKLADSTTTDGNRAVTTNHVRDSAITAAKIANDAVTVDKIINSTIVKSKVNTGAAGGPGVYYNGTGNGGGAITYGTAEPSGVGNEGDIYLRYIV